ncbi:DUF1576 domain-containing protein [Synechococcus sp. RSCCF101]|nr:DUF1576 domain-containing protein [Synechococcus sp. RSCCF101]
MVDPIPEILQGLVAILLTRDSLITDYMGVGGIGAASVNAGLLGLVACGLFYRYRTAVSGGAMACLFLLIGFGLFGKNLLNIWPIIAGVWLSARIRRADFGSQLPVALFSCALAPIVTEILFSTSIGLAVSIPLSLITGLLLGFVVPSAATQLFRAHDGFNLYNLGFTAGIVGTLVVALYKSYGFVPDPVMIWTTGNNALLLAFSLPFLGGLVLTGCLLDSCALRSLRSLVQSPGRAPSDFVAIYGIGPTLVNMGLSGLVALAYLLLIHADLNGPTLGGLFTVVGFAAYGKHPLNITPIILGVALGSIAKPWSLTDPSTVLASLFGTSLAPIAGQFGWVWGVVAGFIHSSAVRTVGFNHAGLNLYNNGFAAGLVAATLVPVISLAGQQGKPRC